MASARIVIGDVRTVLPTVPAESVRCCVTSPPYFGLRDYGMGAQIGLESTPDAYVAELVAVFREVRRVLTDDGTLWLNLGDSYAGAANSGGSEGERTGSGGGKSGAAVRVAGLPAKRGDGIKPKDLLGIPWRVAFALQADGWYLRSDIIWAKPNPMPESVTDRPTKAHEYVFLLSKAARYYYNAAGVAEPAIHAGAVVTNANGKNGQMGDFGATRGGFLKPEGVTVGETRNARTVWTIATRPYAGAHFATMPPELAERCIKAGSAPGDTVLDPFCGSGTTLAVAVGHGRQGLGVELNPTYADLAAQRIGPMLAEVTHP